MDNLDGMPGESRERDSCDQLDELWGKAFPEPIGPWDDLWKLHQAGVGAKALNLAGALDIHVKNQRWSERFRGKRAYIVPVLDNGGLVSDDNPPDDLVAFRLEQPLSYWCHSGSRILLGQFSLDYARYFDKPLFVYSCPLEWLRAGGCGIVILNWEVNWSEIFYGLVGLQIPDRAFYRHAKARFERPFQLPPIWTPT